MTNDKLIIRINELANKAKTIGLTEDEMKEREELRKQYIKNFREKFKTEILDNVYIVEEDGTKTKLTK
ncbi:DUF896 domain-containing protein [uncultured Tyzzerella sp.]|uniref:DUF896 domain-containing protein n=1 Tax=uncultured Tyzzerella sp. TaxID=2321398 RepID=UPI00294218D1|nr:DUF896 domain-containing protein [uncultured Tyzzerella sp.]